MKLLIAALLMLATAPSAEILTGKQFDALTRDTTMHFSADGQYFGSEQFFSGRRTVWRAEDGRCVNGKWDYQAPAICFIYDDGSGPFCWTVEKQGREVTVTSTNAVEDSPPLALELTSQDTQPILCTGPLFGV